MVKEQRRLCIAHQFGYRARELAVRYLDPRKIRVPWKVDIHGMPPVN
jgi:hypothetical protein